MAVNDVIRLTLIQEMHGQVVQNHFHFRAKTAGATALALRTTVAQDLANTLAAQQSAELTHFGARTRGLVPYTDTVETAYPAEIPGTIVGNGLPSLCAAVTGLRTGQPGKSKRGRIYMAGLPAANETDSQLTGAYVTALQAMWTALVAEYGGGGTNADWEWGVFSVKLGGSLIVPTPPKQPYYSDPFNLAGFQAITAAITRSFVSSFVSRKYGRGI